MKNRNKEDTARGVDISAIRANPNMDITDSALGFEFNALLKQTAV